MITVIDGGGGRYSYYGSAPRDECMGQNRFIDFSSHCHKYVKRCNAAQIPSNANSYPHLAAAAFFAFRAATMCLKRATHSAFVLPMTHSAIPVARQCGG